MRYVLFDLLYHAGRCLLGEPLGPASDLLRVDFKPGMPASVTSSGTVTWRSTSSVDAPGNCASTSMMVDARSGYASTLMLMNECRRAQQRTTER